MPSHLLIVGGFVTAIVTNAAVFVASIGDHLDLWAPVANTALLVLLAVVSRRERQVISKKVDTVHESVSHGAAAAASAATAAEASARIVREIGGAMRHVDVSPLDDKSERK